MLILFATGCTNKDSNPSGMPKQEEFGLKRIGEHVDDADCDIIFVHGLGGDGNLTWCHDGLRSNYWPEWLSNDLESCNVWTFTYRATPSAWLGESSEFTVSARELLNEMKAKEIGTSRPIVFICHSLGGLVVKHAVNETFRMAQYVGEDNPEIHPFFSKGVGIAFYATPNEGSDIPDYVDRLGTALRINDLTRSMGKSTDRLIRYQNRIFIDYARYEKKTVRLKCFCEANPIINNQFVVDQDSASIGDSIAEPISGSGHISIVKPEKPNTGADRNFRVFLKETLARFSNPSTFATQELSDLSTTGFEKAIGDYRSEQAKVIDQLTQQRPGKKLEERQIEFLSTVLSEVDMHAKCETAVNVVLGMLNDRTFLRTIEELEDVNGPGGGSANNWLHKLEERTTFKFQIGDESVEESTRWWMIYLGVRNAFQNRLVESVLNSYREKELSIEELLNELKANEDQIKLVRIVAKGAFQNRVGFLNSFFVDAYSDWKEKGSYDHERLIDEIGDGIERKLNSLIGSANKSEE